MKLADFKYAESIVRMYIDKRNTKTKGEVENGNED